MAKARILIVEDNVIVAQDIQSVLIQLEEQLRYAATHDALTGLPNRAYLMERLDHALEYHRRYPNYEFAVLLLDLDRFKIINDSLGHQAGDQVLIIVAERLQEQIRTLDTVQHLNEKERKDGSLARAILLMARELQMDVIAEGIETKEQAAYLKSLDCQYGQGFLFSKPLRGNEVAAFLTSHNNSVPFS